MAELTAIEKLQKAEFQERVRARLAAMNTNATELARKHGWSHQAVLDLISRGPFLQYKSLNKIAEMLDVRVSWLIEGDPRDAFGKRDEAPSCEDEVPLWENAF